MPRGAKALLIGAAACAGTFLLLLIAAYTSSRARWLDASALHGFTGLRGTLVEAVATRIGRLGDAVEAGLVGGALALVALARGRPRVAMAVIVLLAVTSVSSQVLKAALAYPRYEGLVEGARVAPAAFPSGHATAALSLALAGVLVVPPRLRPLAALVGTGFVVALAFSVISLGWHFPSDVVGGFLLATGWALVTMAALQAAAERWPERDRRGSASLALAAAVDRLARVGLVATTLAGVALMAAAGAILIVFRLADVVAYAVRHTAFVVVAAAVAASGAALLAAVTGALRRQR